MTTQPKYEDIPYGQFQGMIDKLMKPKSRLEASKVAELVDDNGRHIEVYYMVCDTPWSAQTDESGDNYIIEQVTYLRRRVRLSGRGEQSILEYLNRMNPAGLKFPVRA